MRKVHFNMAKLLAVGEDVVQMNSNFNFQHAQPKEVKIILATLKHTCQNLSGI